jgi:formylglycine-generating enzyme required for sulfatase activity
MGSPPSDPDRDNDEVQHQVTVSGFYMARYEVTQAEYLSVMGANPSNFQGDNLPVERVSWFDAVNYCNMRSRREGLTPVYTINGENVSWNRNIPAGTAGYRLPTEAEWEYACRAGTGTVFNTGDAITTDQANFDGSSIYNSSPEGSSRQTTTAVGSFAPNSWGLYDMHGNVYEWCWDYYGDYTKENQNDPVGPRAGSYRVGRGGCWLTGAKSLRSAYRSNTAPSDRSAVRGIRLVRTP